MESVYYEDFEINNGCRSFKYKYTILPVLFLFRAHQKRVEKADLVRYGITCESHMTINRINST